MNATSGDKLKKARIKAGLSRQDLANILNIEVQYVGNMELNRIVIPFQYVHKIAEVLNLTVPEVAFIALASTAAYKQYVQTIARKTYKPKPKLYVV